MFCPECGAPNEDDAVYCGNCGALMNPDEMPAIEGDETPVAAPVQEPDADLAGETPEELTEEKPFPLAERSLAPPAEPSLTPPPPVYRTTAQTSGTAIASLVMGIAGWTLFPLVGSILAIVFGYAARREIRHRPDQLTGDGLAVVGLVLGWTMVGLTVAGLCLGAVALCLLLTASGSAVGY
jgi:hypothetical protein